MSTFLSLFIILASMGWQPAGAQIESSSRPSLTLPPLTTIRSGIPPPISTASSNSLSSITIGTVSQTSVGTNETGSSGIFTIQTSTDLPFTSASTSTASQLASSLPATSSASVSSTASGASTASASASSSSSASSSTSSTSSSNAIGPTARAGGYVVAAAGLMGAAIIGVL